MIVLGKFEVSSSGHGCQQNTNRQLAVQAWNAGTETTKCLIDHHCHWTRQSSYEPEETQVRINQRQTIERLGNGDDVSVHEQTPAGRKQRSVQTRHHKSTRIFGADAKPV